MKKPSRKTSDVYDKSSVQAVLNTEVIGCELHWMKRAGSTNDLAMRLAQKGCPEGTLVVAESQSKGRGRHARTWFSPNGGIWMSVVLRSRYHAHHPGMLTLMGALAVARAINKGIGIDARVKWPNDVEVKGRKVAGILGEAAGNRGEAYAVLGIGMNVNIRRSDFPRDLAKTAISLSWACRKKFSRAELLSLTLTHLEDIYLTSKGRRKSEFIQELKKICVTIKRRVRVYGRKMVEGTAIDIDKQGALLVQEDNGHIARMLSGDVILLG